MQYDEPTLVRRLGKLSFAAQCTFAACCAQRLSPAYPIFARALDGKSPNALNEALSSIWAGILPPIERAAFQRLEKQILSLHPTDEEYSRVSPYAEDAVCAAAYTVRTALMNDAQQAAYAARCAFNATDTLINDAVDFDWNSPGVEDRMLACSVVQRELARQERDLAELEALGELKESDVQRFRARAAREPAVLNKFDRLDTLAPESALALRDVSNNRLRRIAAAACGQAAELAGIEDISQIRSAISALQSGGEVPADLVDELDQLAARFRAEYLAARDARPYSNPVVPAILARAKAASSVSLAVKAATDAEVLEAIYEATVSAPNPEAFLQALVGAS